MKRITPIFLGLALSLTACGEKDTVTPLITLAEPTLEIELGETFSPLSYVTANDDVDGNITSSIIVKANDVNMDVPGTYSVVFEVKDSAGNTAQSTMQVVVEEGFSETHLILIEAVQYIVDSLKDPTSFKLFSLQSREYPSSLGIKIDCSATNSYGGVVRTAYFLAYFYNGSSNWPHQLEHMQDTYDIGWYADDYVINDENTEKILKRINLYF